MSMRHLWLYPLALVLAAGVPALADDKPKHKEKDKNKHEQVNRGNDRHDDDDDRDHERSGQMRFKGLDRNGDGMITRAEWQGNDQSFRVHDRNGDGVLKGAEVRTGRRRSTSGLGTHQSWDRNGDGWLSRQEWRGDRRTFDRLDVDDNDRVTATELRRL